jgi:hypothetical protein
LTISKRVIPVFFLFVLFWLSAQLVLMLGRALIGVDVSLMLLIKNTAMKVIAKFIWHG